MIRHFLFHRVSPERDLLWDPMDPELFERVIKHITEKFEVISMESMVDGVPDSDKKLATVTFDDGYKDNLEYAVPILRKYNCPASFYVVTDCIDRNVPTWTYVIDHYYQEKPELEEKLGPSKDLKARLKKTSTEERNKVVQMLEENHPEVTLPKMMLSWDDLRSMRDMGFTIGSHSASHPPFATLDDVQIENEMKASAKRIKEELKQFPITISYPVGSYDERTKRIAKAVGYRMGLATGQKFQKGSVDLFAIPRTELYNESWRKTKARISGNLEKLKKLIGR